jgi:hypothetical protein
MQSIYCDSSEYARTDTKPHTPPLVQRAKRNADTTLHAQEVEREALQLKTAELQGQLLENQSALAQAELGNIKVAM